MSANNAELDQNLLAGMFEACNARDIDAVTAYFADDAVFDWFNGQRFEGKAAIRDIMATALGMIWVKIWRPVTETQISHRSATGTRAMP